MTQTGGDVADDVRERLARIEENITTLRKHSEAVEGLMARLIRIEEQRTIDKSSVQRLHMRLDDLEAAYRHIERDLAETMRTQRFAGLVIKTLYGAVAAAAGALVWLGWDRLVSGVGG